jgi:hypothetical protein
VELFLGFQQSSHHTSTLKMLLKDWRQKIKKKFGGLKLIRIFVKK